MKREPEHSGHISPLSLSREPMDFNKYSPGDSLRADVGLSSSLAWEKNQGWFQLAPPVIVNRRFQQFPGFLDPTKKESDPTVRYSRRPGYSLAIMSVGRTPPFITGCPCTAVPRSVKRALLLNMKSIISCVSRLVGFLIDSACWS